MSGRGPGWTEYEDHVLRKYLPRHGPSWEGWAKVLPGRSQGSIMSRKKKLGIAGPRSRGRTASARQSAPWTEEQRIELVECAMATTKLCGHSIGECAVELARIIRAWKQARNQKGNG